MRTTGTPICPVLVGRDDLLALAGRRLEAAADGHGSLLFLAGEAGIGKTRLLGSVERRAATLGFSIAKGEAFPQDAEVAGGLLLDLARSLRRSRRFTEAGDRLEQLLSGGNGAATGPDADAATGTHRGPVIGDAHHRRRVLVLDVVDVLAALPEIGSILITFEDLHWADDLSLEVLAMLARRLPELPFQVVATYRSDELYPRVPMRDWRSRLLAGRMAEEARVSRLGREGTASMITLILGADLPAPAQLVDSIHQRSDGVPLHVEELLATTQWATDSIPVDPRQDVQAQATAAAPPRVAVPETLEVAILRRSERLSPRARSVAGAAAVIGRSFDLDLLATVVARPTEQLAAPLSELERAFFIQRSAEDGRFDFRHALIRDALYEDLPLPTRRGLHGRVADATIADPRFGDAFRSVHLEEARRGPEAYAAALAAGRRAVAVSAHREALELLERALRNLPADTPGTERAALLMELADEAVASDANQLADGSFSEAEQLLLEAGDRRAATSLIPRHVAVRHLLGDHLEARMARLSAGLEALDGAPDDNATKAVRARLLGGMAAANMLDRRLEAAIEYGEASRALATAIGDVSVTLDVAATVGSCLVFAGRMSEGWSLLEEAVDQARGEGREADAARAYRMIGSCASVLVEYDLGERWLREGIDYAERVELWNHRHYMAAHLAHVAWASGDWSLAERLAGHALADGRGGITTRITALHVLGYVALTQGDLARARVTLDEARVLGEEMSELQRLSPAVWGLAEAAVLAGEHAAAIEWCERGREASARVADAAYLFPFLVTGTRAYLAAHDPAGATTWYERVSSTLRTRGIPGTLPAIDHAMGLIELARGATGQARTSLEAAHTGWLDRRRIWEGTWAALDLAAVHQRSRRPNDARVLIDAAAVMADRLGSQPLAAASRALARQLQSRTGSDPAWAPLTARELEVARLIRDGLTNGAIATQLGITPRTAGAHVEHILGKLGVTRRAEIAAWVASRIPGEDA